MPSKYQSTIRVSMFLGLALVCLEVTLLIILSPWTKILPRSSPSMASRTLNTVTTTPQQNPDEVRDTRGAWLVVRGVALPAGTITQECRGQYRVLKTSDQVSVIYCLNDFRVRMSPATETQKYELLTIQNTTSSNGLSLQQATQLGSATDQNARLLFQVDGLADCDNDMMGCGFNYTLRLADLAKPDAVTHFTNSDVRSAEPKYWNADYTKGYTFLGVCEGGCIPEPLYGWNIKDGKMQALTSEEAYLSQEHYDGRIPDLKNDPYKHWGAIKWVDLNHVEAQLIDQNGKITKLRKEVK